jgi:hypothetical protein
MELYTSCWEAQSVMGVTILLFLRVKEEKTPMVSGEKTMLWHQILGHIGEKGLQSLHSKGMVEGMFDCTLDFDLCEHYIYGKHNRVRFSSGATREKGILELVHSDVFGPVLFHH